MPAAMILLAVGRVQTTSAWTDPCWRYEGITVKLSYVLRLHGTGLGRVTVGKQDA